MPGAATANNTGQNNSVVVIRSSINNVLAHAEVLEKDVNPRTAFDRKSVTPDGAGSDKEALPDRPGPARLGLAGKKPDELPQGQRQEGFAVQRLEECGERRKCRATQSHHEWRRERRRDDDEEQAECLDTAVARAARHEQDA